MLVDMLRQFAITAAILVVVIAFGATIKPLSSGGLLTGLDTLRYLALAIVPMLQFAIPFAAAFAATICLHRMAQDNEIIAMLVSGQSYTKLLAPVALFGVVLTIVIAVLAQTTIPTFVRKMAEAMTADIPKLLTHSVRQNTPFVQGDLVIWAEDLFVDQMNGDEKIALDHVAVAKLDRFGKADMILTSSAALVDVQRNQDQTSLLLSARDASQWTRREDSSGIFRGSKELQLTHGIDLPTLTSRRPSSLTRKELLLLREDPSNYPQVNSAVKRLKADLLRIEFLDSLQQQFSKDQIVSCTAKTGGRRFVIEAAGLNGNKFKPPISVTTIRGTGERNLLAPSQANFLLDQSAAGKVESVTLQMVNVIVGAGEVGENIRGELMVPNLVVDEISGKDLDGATITSLLEIAGTHDVKQVKNSVKSLQKHLVSMEYQIIGRMAQRLAVSLLPVLSVLLGGLLAFRFSDRLPLVVYGKVFIPVVFALLLVFSGGQMIRDAKELIGFCVMWSGNIFVFALVVFHWFRLGKT
ncbi:MAG: LptF/LptG family permease [Planctomycetota bacterium]|nr:LptF/LptG family permease [Planctomycetota bacterium]